MSQCQLQSFVYDMNKTLWKGIDPQNKTLRISLRINIYARHFSSCFKKAALPQLWHHRYQYCIAAITIIIKGTCILVLWVGAYTLCGVCRDQIKL